MLSRYVEQLKKLVELLSHGKSMDFRSYVEALKLTALILLQSVGFIMCIVAVLAVPYYIKRKIRLHFNDLILKAQNKEEADKVVAKSVRVNIAFWIVLIAVYVPFAIPTVLLFL